MNFWSAVVCVAFGLAGAEECEDAGVCLLSLRSARPAGAHPGRSFRVQLVAWKVQHAKLRQAMSSSASTVSLDMDDFISQQTASTDACHAKMLEAKRTLDGLHQKVLALSGEIEAHNAIIVAQTGIIDESTQRKQDAVDLMATEMQKCQDGYDYDMLEVLGYDKELLELRQIANPAVRSAIKHDTDYHEAWQASSEKAHTDAVAKADASIVTSADAWAAVKDMNLSTSLVQTGEWTQQQCRNTIDALQRLRPERLAALQLGPDNVTYVELDCNGTRIELQTEFTTAYEEIAKLRVDTQADVDQSKTSCEGVASGKEEAERIRENAAINQASSEIDEARETINALDPLLDEAKSALQKVQDHVQDLEANCGSNTDVTEHLKKIRALIESLDACPGRHDFTLTKPDLTKSF